LNEASFPRLALALLAIPLAGPLVGSCRELPAPIQAQGRSQAVPEPSKRPAPRAPADPLEVIARYEDARSDGDGLLESLLSGGSETTRERAAVALGRLPFPERGSAVTRALCQAAKDPSARVRAAAAFAFGMRGDPAAVDALTAACSDGDPAVRARAVEAASRVDDPRAHGQVLDALRDESEPVRCEAAIGPHRWKRDAPDAEAAETALVAAAQPPSGAEVAWRALFSLARRGSIRARGAFEAGLASTDARARIFGAQGLRSIPAEGSSTAKLRAALADADWRVASEAALALGEHPDPSAIADLEGALRNRSTHVRRCAAEALGRFGVEKDAIGAALEALREDPSADVRCSGIVSRARLDAAKVAGEVTRLAHDPSPLMRGGAAGAAALLPDPQAVPLLVVLSKDPDRKVADVAAHGLKDHPTPESRARVAEMLADADNGLRLAAAEVLKDIGRAEDLPAIERCLETSRGDIAAEVASNLLDVAAKIGGERARAILARGASHANAFVRRKARALLEKEPGGADIAEPETPAPAPARVPVAGTDYRASGPNPRVEVVTSRGSMVFELLRDEAPVHVFNFLELARAKFYDGTTFHRVVPDFVVQGGDPRGDGNGGKTWRGEPLRAELTPRKFVRGSLGMPRNDDPDSGGSQIFVTHRETPHLDGRYTLFGELRGGFDVLDAIEVGDVIRSVRILEDRRPR